MELLPGFLDKGMLCWGTQKRVSRQGGVAGFPEMGSSPHVRGILRCGAGPKLRIAKDCLRAATSRHIGCCNDHAHTHPPTHTAARAARKRRPAVRLRKPPRRLLELRSGSQDAKCSCRLLLSDGYRRPADGDVHKPVVDAAAHENRALHRSVRRRRAPLLTAVGQGMDHGGRSQPPAGARCLLPL